MVFSSVPLYLDPPNWQQHQNLHHQQQHLQQGTNNNNNTGNHHDQSNNQHLLQPPQLQPQQPPHMGGGPGGVGASAIRPNSMAERARIAKIPAPEAPLKCPRCDSTNTKFCYFNNYSLTQPRHFCKTCRRYWTRGGALRNVPVGGGCRRNKRSSSKSNSGGGGGGGGGSSSKSSLSSPTGIGGGGDRHMDLMSSAGLGHSITGLASGGGGGGAMSFMASLQNMAQLGMGNLGLTFGGSLHAPQGHHPNHHALGGLAGLTGGDQHQHPHQNQMDHFNASNLMSHQAQGGGHHHHQVQFPNLLGGFEVPGGSSNDGGLYTSAFQNDQGVVIGGGGGGGGGGGVEDENGHEDHQVLNGDENNVSNMSKGSSVNSMNMMSSSPQMAPVKMEDGQGLNLAKQLMGISTSSENGMGGGGSNNNNQFWGGAMGNRTAGGTNMWTDLSTGFNSSSTSHLM